jgi:hypothetical protein
LALDSDGYLTRRRLVDIARNSHNHQQKQKRPNLAPESGGDKNTQRTAKTTKRQRHALLGHLFYPKFLAFFKYILTLQDMNVIFVTPIYIIGTYCV